MRFWLRSSKKDLCRRRINWLCGHSVVSSTLVAGRHEVRQRNRHLGSWMYTGGTYRWKSNVSRIKWAWYIIFDSKVSWPFDCRSLRNLLKESAIPWHEIPWNSLIRLHWQEILRKGLSQNTPFYEATLKDESSRETYSHWRAETCLFWWHQIRGFFTKALFK